MELAIVFMCLFCQRRRILYGGKLFRFRLGYGAKYEYQHPALTICDRRWRILKHLEGRGTTASLRSPRACTGGPMRSSLVA